MSLKSIQSLYKMLNQELTSGVASNDLDSSISSPTTLRRNTKDSISKKVETLLITYKIPIFLVLDEIDQIETTIKSTSDIYKIFEWPFLANSKLNLIGIANSLDFTDRLLPRLELKPECKPIILKFMPYSKEDIISIIKDRLQTVQKKVNSDQTLIDDRALTLCASKIASLNGDIRKVLDICRKAIEEIEKEYIENSQNETGPLKCVSIAHMMRIFNNVNPVVTSNIEKNSMPLMQKILLCTVLLMTKQMRSKEVLLSKVV
jgi:cell division control protein 6